MAEKKSSIDEMIEILEKKNQLYTDLKSQYSVFNNMVIDGFIKEAEHEIELFKELKKTFNKPI